MTAIWLLLVVGGEPVGLEAALDEGLRQGPAAALATVRHQAAVRAAELTRPRLRPDLSIVADGEVRTPEVRDPAPPGAIVDPAAGARIELRAEQMIYHAGRGALSRQAALAVVAAEADLAAARSAARLELTLAWLDLFEAQAGVQRAGEAVEMARSQVAWVTELLAAERVPPIDRRRAEAGAAQAAAALLTAEAGQAAAAGNLSRLLGRPVDTTLRVGPLPPAPADVGLLEALLKRALEHRPELRALAARRDQALAAADFARAERRPTVSLFGNAAAQTSSAFRDGHDLGVGLRLTVPFTRADDRPARDQAAYAAAAEEATLGIAALRAGIELEVQTAWANLAAARERVGLAQIQVDAADAAKVVANQQYQLARVTIHDVEAAGDLANTAYLERIRATVDLHRALADLRFAAALNEEPTDAAD